MSGIKKIVIDIDGKEIKLSVDQARELKDILLDMWPEQTVINVPSPIVIERWPEHRPYWQGPRITWCASETSDGTARLTTTSGCE